MYYIIFLGYSLARCPSLLYQILSFTVLTIIYFCQFGHFLVINKFAHSVLNHKRMIHVLKRMQTETIELKLHKRYDSRIKADLIILLCNTLLYLFVTQLRIFNWICFLEVLRKSYLLKGGRILKFTSNIPNPRKTLFRNGKLS